MLHDFGCIGNVADGLHQVAEAYQRQAAASGNKGRKAKGDDGDGFW